MRPSPALGRPSPTSRADARDPGLPASPAAGEDAEAEWSRRLHARLQQADVAPALFLPPARAAWKGDRLLLDRAGAAEVRTRISGVRLQAADPQGEDLLPERQVQADVVHLVASVRRMRETPDLENLVLSRDHLVVRKTDRYGGRRVKFGLQVDPEGRLAGDEAAAVACHASIRRGIRRAGLVVVAPRTFDATTGLAGLEAWGSELRLRRRRRPWWLLLLPLLALLLLLRDCQPAATFFGVPIETRSFVLVLDKSGSMKPHFGQVQDEARRLLDRLIATDGTWHANLIAYDAEASSALGQIEAVDATTAGRMLDFLGRLKAGGGTRLSAAIERAAAEVRTHGRPTTIVVLSDGEDKSVAELVQNAAAVRATFGEGEVVIHTLTPRLFGGASDTNPRDSREKILQTFSERFGGRFGHDGGSP